MDGPKLFRLDEDTGILYPRQSLKGLQGKYNQIKSTFIKYN